MRYLRLKKPRRWYTCQTPSTVTASTENQAKPWTRRSVESGVRVRRTVGRGEALLARLEVLHLLEDFVGGRRELAQLGLHAGERLLVRDGVVVDRIAAEVHVEVDVADEVVAWVSVRRTFSAVHDAHAEVCVVVGVDRKARLIDKPLLAEVHVVVRAVHDLHLDALVGGRVWVARHDVDRDNGERVLHRVVPDAHRRRALGCRQLKLDRGGARREAQQPCPNPHRGSGRVLC